MKEIEMDLDAAVTGSARKEERTRLRTIDDDLNRDAKAPLGKVSFLENGRVVGIVVFVVFHIMSVVSGQPQKARYSSKETHDQKGRI